MKYKYYLIVLITALSLIRCYPSLAESSLVPSQEEYTLGPGDRLQIGVFQNEQLSGEHLVLVDGTIALPLIGTINVQGKSPSELSTLLSKLYATYLKYPNVIVNIVNPRPLNIIVAGEVNNPGQYNIDSQQGQNLPLLTDLIQQAGGLTTVADISKVEVRRLIQGQEEFFQLNLWELLQNNSTAQNLRLRDGDKIFIPTKESIDLSEVRQLVDVNFGIQPNQELNVAVIGEVYRPGPYKIVSQIATSSTIDQQLTTFGTKPPRLSSAIQLAGGIKPLADIRNISIERYHRDGSQQIIEIDLWNLLQTGNVEEDIILQEGDRIIIPTAQEINPEESESFSSASFAPNVIRINVVGEVIRPGIVEVPPNTSLNEAILAAGGFDKRRAKKGKVEVIRVNPNGTVTKRDIKIDFEQGIEQENNPILFDKDIVVINRSGLTAATDTLNTIVSPVGSALGLVNLLNIVFP